MSSIFSVLESKLAHKLQEDIARVIALVLQDSLHR